MSNDENRKGTDSLKAMLDREADRRNRPGELSSQRPDPLPVASRYRDERIALLCALFGYGNAGLIVRFLPFAPVKKRQ